MMYKILVVEDDQRVAELLKRGLEELNYSVSLTFDGEMGFRLFRAEKFDLIISDIILPQMNGFELIKKIKLINSSIPIIMLTALGTMDDKLEGFDAGADDYMVKPFDIREISARIQVLLKRKSNTKPDIVSEIEYADLKINLLQKKVFRSGIEIALTPKEFNLLVYMVENPERVLSRVEITEKVWNTYFDTGTNFIDVYINYLRKKIDKSFNEKLIHTKSGMGFMLKSNNEDKK